GPPLPVGQEQLERVLGMHEDLGLRCIGVPAEGGGEPLVAGNCTLSTEEIRHALDDPPPFGVMRIDRNAGMVAGRPRWPRGFGGTPPAVAPWGGRRPLPSGFEPLEAHALQRSGTRSLIAGLAALAGLSPA